VPHYPPVLDRLRERRGTFLFVLGGVAVGLVPWTTYVSITLPARHLTDHWDVLWTGFDVFEVTSIAATVVVLRRQSRFLPVVAAVAGTALASDGWFDVVTARPGRELGWSLFGLVGEVPLAALCFWLALDALSALAAPASAADPRSRERPDRSEAAQEPARTAGSEAPSAGRTSR
jgi:hypothetical protein